MQFASRAKRVTNCAQVNEVFAAFDVEYKAPLKNFDKNCYEVVTDYLCSLMVGLYYVSPLNISI